MNSETNLQSKLDFSEKAKDLDKESTMPPEDVPQL